MLLVNEMLNGRYRIVRQLGHGGMGAVYEAHDNVFDTTCAIKEIMIDTVKAPSAQQQELIKAAFEREAKLLAKIKHEVVPHVRDYFSHENRQFLVMELVEGKELGDMLEELKSPFPIDDVVRWLDQLLDALDYLHTQNPPIYHRDIKPHNLKLTPRGKIKLLDFGIAKGGAATEAQNASTVGNQTFVAATLNYSPIEQTYRVLDPVFREVLLQRFESRIKVVMEQNADARTDIYALGATVYHLLTGVLPIDSLKRTTEVWSGKQDPLANPNTLNPQVPPALANLLMKAMEIDRDHRFSSALEMQQALVDALGGIPSARNTNPTAEAAPTVFQTLDTGQTGSVSDAPTVQIPSGQLQTPAPSSISEQTIQSGGFTPPPTSNITTGGQPPPVSSPFNTGGQQPPVSSAFDTGGQQPPVSSPFNTGGQPPPVSSPFDTGGQPPPVSSPFNTGGQQTPGSSPFNTGGQQPPVSGSLQVPVSNPFNTSGQTGGGQQLTSGQQFAAQPAPKRKGRALLIAIPILGLLFLGVAGAGGGIWWYMSQQTTTTTPTPTASPTAAASPSPTEKVTKTETPTPSPSSSPSATPADTKPLVGPTPAKTPPPAKTPKPKATTKKNSDCIFTGDC